MQADSDRFDWLTSPHLAHVTAGIMFHRKWKIPVSVIMAKIGGGKPRELIGKETMRKFYALKTNLSLFE